MGADSPSQNGGAEIYNNTLAVKVRTSLYNSMLPAKFWSAALLYAVYLHNRLVHSAIKKTPYKAWYGCKQDVTHLKTFGFWVCVKRTGSQWCKLDQHNFTRIFLGYTTTNQNISHLDLSSGIVKTCHHMPSLMRLGIFNRWDPQWHNFCTTLAWNLNPTLSLSMDLSIQPLQVPSNLFLSLGLLSHHHLSNQNLSGRTLCQASWLPYHFASQRHWFKSQLACGTSKDDR